MKNIRLASHFTARLSLLLLFLMGTGIARAQVITFYTPRAVHVVKAKGDVSGRRTKVKSAKSRSSEELKFLSSQATLSYRVAVATDAFIPRRHWHKP